MKLDVEGGPGVDGNGEPMQQAGQVGRSQMKEGLVDEGEPVNVTASVKRGPVNQRVKSAVMCVERGVSSKADSGVIDSVKFRESGFACSSIDSVTEIQSGENGHLDESKFGGRSEGVTISIEESKFCVDL